jgi:hypothetical protein
MVFGRKQASSNMQGVDGVSAGSDTSNSPSMKDGNVTLQVREASGRNRGDATTYASAGLDAYYKPIERYEGYHRYDPNFDWEPEEERRLIRKVRSIDVIH